MAVAQKVAPASRRAAMPEMHIDVVDSPAKVQRFWEWLTSHHDFVAADTETSGLDWWSTKFRIRLFQFGDKDGYGWAIPFQQWRGLVEGSLRWLDDNRVTTVWHNLAYDMSALQSEGITLDMTNQADTFIYASLCGYAEDARGIKTIAAREFGDWALFGQKLLETAMKNAGWTWDTVPLDFKPYVVYGAVDPILTAMYYGKLTGRREEFEWHHSLEVATIDLTGTMMRNGLPVDTIYCSEQVEVLTAKETEYLTEMAKHGIPSAFSNVAVAEVLQKAGIPQELIKYTESGQVEVTKDFLESVDHPVAKLVLEARRNHKTRTYLLAMLKSAGGVLSRRELIHPEIRSSEARTGRMSVANPALQQLPAPDEDDPQTMIVRRAIVPREDGHVLVGADYGQIELRVVAAMTRDTNLLAVLRTMDKAKLEGDKANSDFFVALGRDVYHDPSFVKSDPRRGKLKATIYATMYSAGEAKIAQTAKVSQREIHDVLEVLKERYQTFRTLGAELIQTIPNGPYGEPVSRVRTPTGREFAVAHRSERRKLLNYLVQGHSAEILKMALQNAREAGLEEYLVLPVHDEIIMSVPKEFAEEATRLLTEAMDSVVDPEVYGVAVRASAAAPALNWAELDH